MRTFLRNLRRDTRGGAMVEFAILAPAIFAMMFGVLQVGVQMFSYNALRSIAADVTRFEMIQYQQGISQTTDQVRAVLVSTATGPAYQLNGNTFDATVTTPTSDIAGMTKFTMVLTYTPPNPLGFYNIGALNLSLPRSFYVSSSV
jgi:Flp pilus assembly protein TadG